MLLSYYGKGKALTAATGAKDDIHSVIRLKAGLNFLLQRDLMAERKYDRYFLSDWEGPVNFLTSGPTEK